MNEQVKYILEYQDVDKQLKDIEDSLKKSEEAQKYYGASKFLKSVGELISNIDLKAKTMIESYNATLEEISKLQKVAEEYSNSVDTCESEDELNYLKKKFQETVNAISQKETAVKNLHKSVDDVFKEFSKLREDTAKMQAQYNEYRPKFNDLKNSKIEEVNSLKSKLLEIAKNVDDTLMNKYTAKREDKKFPIVFGVDTSKKDCYCPACATGMSISAKNELVQGNVKECENCRRLLYSL